MKFKIALFLAIKAVKAVLPLTVATILGYFAIRETGPATILLICALMVEIGVQRAKLEEKHTQWALNVHLKDGKDLKEAVSELNRLVGAFSKDKKPKNIV